MQIATVIPLKRGIQKEELSYFTGQHVTPGIIVRVPVRRSTVNALVVDVKSVEAEKNNIKNADFNLKKITEILGPSPLRNELFDTLSELKEYYITETGSLINLVLPSFIFNSYEDLSRPEQILTQVQSENIAQEKLIYQANIEDRLSYYKTYIRASFAKKQSVFIILPTIHEIESVALALKKGIETYTFVLHSDISEKETVLLYNQIVDEEHPVVIIATAGFLAIPRHDIGTIIVEHESSSAYKTVARPYADLRLVAELFSKKIGVKFILSDTLLRTETLWRHTKHEFGEVMPVSFRRANDVPVEVIDMRQETEMIGREKQVAILGANTKEILEELNTRSGHVFLFTLKKGLASVTECNDCKRVVSCLRCKNPLTLRMEEGKKKIFYCTTCKETTDTHTRCITCGSWNLVALGIGSERTRELFEKLYPNIPIFSIDKDSIKSDSAARKVMDAFYAEKRAVLIGTELALFYLEKKVDYTVVVSFDSFFSIPNFRINERIIGLVSSLTSYTEKKLIIQTRNPDEKVLQAITIGNFYDLSKREMADREMYKYPPFTTLIKVSVAGGSETLEKAKGQFAEQFEEYNPIILDTKSRIRGYETASMILKVPRTLWSPIELFPGANLDKTLSEKLRILSPRWSIVIDPYDLN